MIRLMWSRIRRFQFLLPYRISDVTILTKIKIKTVFAFVSNPNNRIHLTPMTFDIFPYLLSGFHNQFNSMCWIMSSDFEFTLVILSGKVTILTHAEVNAICADETSSNYGSHVTANTFVIIVSRKTIGKKR